MGIKLDWINFPDLGTSYSPTLYLTVDRKVQSFSRKLSDLLENERMKLELWIKLSGKTNLGSSVPTLMATKSWIEWILSTYVSNLIMRSSKIVANRPSSAQKRSSKMQFGDVFLPLRQALMSNLTRLRPLVSQSQLLLVCADQMQVEWEKCRFIFSYCWFEGLIDAIISGSKSCWMQVDPFSNAGRYS